MSITAYLREIGRGKDGARSLSRLQACDLMSQVLSGQVSDLQLGGFALAMRIKGETAEELAGFLDAVQPLLLPLHAPGPAVVLPSYNGARKLPNLTLLLATLLARRGVSVLVHGPRTDPGRTASAEVAAALGWELSESAAHAQARWAAAQPVFMPVDALHPPLARLLQVRRELGLRNSGHTLAKLLPAVQGGAMVRVVNHTHPEYATSLAALLQLTTANAVLMRGTEGEPVADARRQPRLAAYVGGVLREDLSVPAQEGSLARLPELGAGIDPAATARHIEAFLGGAVPVPAPIVTQVECLWRVLQALQPPAGTGGTQA